MDQFEQRLDGLTRQLNSRIDQTSSKASNSMLLTFLLMLVVLIFVAWFGNRYVTAINNRLDQLEATIKSSDNVPKQATPSRPQESQSASNPEINSLKDRMTALETLQESMVTASKGALEQMNFVFAITAAFLAMFSIFLAYRQVTADSSREKHDAEMTTLVESSRKNIDVINVLIGTLEKSYSYREEVDARIKELDKQISEVEKYKQKSEQSLHEKIAVLNKDAFALFLEVDREKFKAEDNKGRMENLYVNMNTLEKMGGVTAFLSPFCYFLRALHFFNVTQYELAQQDLGEASRLALREAATKVDNRTSGWYGDYTGDKADAQLNRMLDDCSYHLGITNYNLGEYKEAREKFQEAYVRNRMDFRARSYIPELMFFDGRSRFADVTAEFKAVEKELKDLSASERSKLDWSTAMASLKIREGNCYLPKMIPLPLRSGYRSEENSERALALYWEAFEAAKKIKKPSLTEVFARFSLAQALEPFGRTEWRDQDRDKLFQEVFNDVRNQIVLKTEPILLMLLNYTLAICAKRANISGENPRLYLARTREQLQRVPTRVRIFSPINKINLTREDILWEIEEFEKSLS